MIINPLPDYLIDEDKILYDYIDDDDIDEKEKSIFFKKLKYRIGNITILFNSLEREIEEYILDTLNERGEDSRIWIILQDLSSYKKIIWLKKIFLDMAKHLDKETDKIVAEINNLFTQIDDCRVKRNSYIHTNYLNNMNLKYFETKVKHIKKQNQYLRIKKHIKLTDIETLANNIEKCSNDLYEFSERFNELFLS